MNSMSGEKLKGIPYTGTLPAVLTGTKAGYLHKYKIYGNTVQTGTPTPSDPIVPQECGERTENLFNENTVLVGYRFGSDGNLFLERGYSASEFISIFPNTSYYRNYTFNINECICFYDENKLFIKRYTTSSNVVTSPVNAYYARISIRNERVDTTMLNSGSTALPYEPHGYKIPLISAGQDVDIYLGESQTTRRIKKLVLTGEEDWRTLSTPNYTYAVPITPYLVDTTAISSHFIQRHTLSILTSKTFMLANSDEIYIKYNNKTSVNDFKQFLAQQYANGTPVTIWYVLSTEETGTLNEPLRKIGNYSDTIDSTQTSVQIPTSANSTTISWAGSGLASSQFDSIQEWVDIPTYTYTNGAWVEDT